MKKSFEILFFRVGENIREVLKVDPRMEFGLKKLTNLMDDAVFLRRKNAFDTVNLNSEYYLRIKNQALKNLERIARENLLRCMNKLRGFNEREKVRILQNCLNNGENKNLNVIKNFFAKLKNSKPQLYHYSTFLNLIYHTIKRNRQKLQNSCFKKLKDNYFKNSENEFEAAKKISELKEKFTTVKKSCLDNIFRSAKENTKRRLYLTRLYKILNRFYEKSSKKDAMKNLKNNYQSFKNQQDTIQNLFKLIALKMKEKQRLAYKILTFEMLDNWKIGSVETPLDFMTRKSNNRALEEVISIAKDMKKQDIDLKKLATCENMALTLSKIFKKSLLSGFSHIFAHSKFRVFFLYHHKINRWNKTTLELTIDREFKKHQKVVYGSIILKKALRKKSRAKLLEAFNSIYSKYLKKLGYSNLEIGLEILNSIIEKKQTQQKIKSYYFIKNKFNANLQYCLINTGILVEKNGSSLLDMVKKNFRKDWKKRGKQKAEGQEGAVVHSRYEEINLKGVKPMRKGKDFRDHRVRKEQWDGSGEKAGSIVTKSFVVVNKGYK